MTEDTTLADELSELFRENVSVGAIRQREFGGAKIAVTTMSYRTSSHSSSGASQSKYYEQTAVVLDDDQLHLPEFSLSPSVKGLLGKVLKAFANFAAVEFPDTPEFSEQYLVHGFAQQPVRVLFTKAVREHFAANLGWSVRGKKNRLVIFKSNHVCGEDEIDAFTQQSLEILGLFQEGEEELDEHPEIRRDVRPEDVSAAAAQMGGIAGAMLQKQLNKIAITPAEIEKFAAAQPPRDVPPGMRRQVVGDNLAIALVGIIFMIGGFVGGTVWLMMTEGIFRLLAIPFFLFVPVAGFLMTFLTLRHRKRKTRALREGIISHGTVTDVKKSSVVVNGQMRFLVTVQYDHQGQQRTTTTNAYGTAIDQARALLDSGQATRLLIDPQDESHVVCLDMLMVFE